MVASCNGLLVDCPLAFLAYCVLCLVWRFFVRCALFVVYCMLVVALCSVLVADWFVQSVCCRWCVGRCVSLVVDLCVMCGMVFVVWCFFVVVGCSLSGVCCSLFFSCVVRCLLFVGCRLLFVVCCLAGVARCLLFVVRRWSCVVRCLVFVVWCWVLRVTCFCLL